MEIPTDALCCGSKSLLFDPVTTPDGQTYSYEVAISLMQKNTNFLGDQTSALFPNNGAKQRVDVVRDQLAEYWSPENLLQLSQKQLVELLAQTCDPVLTKRVLELPNINTQEVISNTVRACRRKNNIKVLYRLHEFRPYICVVCCNYMDQQTQKTCINHDHGHVNCMLTEVLRKKDFLVTVIQDSQRNRALEYTFLPQKGFICLDNQKKRPQWMKELCMAVKRIMCFPEDVDVWYHPSTSDVVVTNLDDEYKNLPTIWLITKEDDLKSIFAQVWHKKNYIHLIMIDTDDKQLVKEINAALAMIVRIHRETVKSVVKLCYS